MKESVVCKKCMIFRALALALWIGAILWLSLTPHPPTPSIGLLSWDKLQHAGAYLVLTALAGRLFVLLWQPFRRAWLRAFWLGFGVGCFVEVAQGLLSRVRVAEPGDLIANGLGALTALVLAHLWERRRKAGELS